MKYNPADAAKACNVSVNTIRGWIRDYGEHFTPSARGESGNRLLSDKDLNTLKYIASLRLEGLQKPAIAQRLQEVAIGDTETLVALQAPSIVSEALQKPTEAAVMPLAMLEHYEALEKRMDARLTAIEANNRSWVQGLAVGFIGAALFFLILLLLISIYHR